MVLSLSGSFHVLSSEKAVMLNHVDTFLVQMQSFLALMPVDLPMQGVVEQTEMSALHEGT